MENKFNVLLVDDDQDFIDPIAYWLEAKEYAVRTAPNGKEALKMIGQEVPHLVILDINMPVMNGADTLMHIREKHKDLPVIMITAEPEKISMFQEMGISGFFPKEGTFEQLERLLEPILRIHARMSGGRS